MSDELINRVVRRAILDLLDDIGGEHNHETLQIVLTDLGHRVARAYVRDQLQWLADRGLVEVEAVRGYAVASIRPDGRDVAQGLHRVEGISQHKTGA